MGRVPREIFEPFSSYVRLYNDTVLMINIILLNKNVWKTGFSPVSRSPVYYVPVHYILACHRATVTICMYKSPSRFK